MKTISKGKKIAIAYTLSSEGKLIKCVSSQKPFRYVYGKKGIVSGLEKRLKGLKVGDQREFKLSPREGYGLEDPKSIMESDRSKFPSKDHFVGKQIISKRDGKFLATVKAVKERTLVLNFNHPLAGKALLISIEIVSIDGSRDVEK